MKLLGKDLTDEEAGEVVDQLEGEMEDTETKSILCKAHKDTLAGAGGFLEEASNHTGSWEDEHRTKAASWHKALGEIGAEEAPPEEFVEGEGEPGEMGQKALVETYKGREIYTMSGGSGFWITTKPQDPDDMVEGPFSTKDEAKKEIDTKGKSLPNAAALQKALDQQQKDLEAFNKTLKKLESVKL